MQIIDENTIVIVIKIFASIGAIVMACELISIRNEFRNDGVFNWEIMQVDFIPYPKKIYAHIINYIMAPVNFSYVILLKGVAAIFLLLFLSNWIISLICIGLICFTTLLYHLRAPYGLDGSDQMLLIVFISLFLYTLFVDYPLIRYSSIFFVALQSCLSYATAGFSKLISPIWRSGDALTLIMNTETYGSKSISKTLMSYPALAKFLAWIVIIFECAFPLVLFLGLPGYTLFLGWGITFHISNATFMGLNTFFWSFTASYPAILFTATQMQIVVY